MTPWAFISYRRQGGKHLQASHIAQALEARVGAGALFCDVQSIQSGDDWQARITAALETCYVLLVLVDADWSQAAAPKPGDWLRHEIATALAQGSLVLPILLDGARMPTEEELGVDLAPLSRRQCAYLETRSAEMFRIGIQVLAEKLLSAARCVVSFDRTLSPIDHSSTKMENDDWTFYVDGLPVLVLRQHDRSVQTHVIPGPHSIHATWYERERQIPRIPTYFSSGSTAKSSIEFRPGSYVFTLKPIREERSFWRQLGEALVPIDKDARILEQVPFTPLAIGTST